jgi:hypothetical protein
VMYPWILLYLLLRICSCTSTKDIRHLIKLSFNTSKPTRGLDALSHRLLETQSFTAEN